jgi:hypothetical protein
MAVSTDVADEHRVDLWREAATMVLYVSVVEIAEFASLPEIHGEHGVVTGSVSGQLLAIVWGTSVGLALAHWFAFRIAAPAFRGGRPTRLDTQIGLVQLAGAAFVAVLASLPALLLSPAHAQETTADVPAVLIGIVGYLIARATGRSRLRAAVYGALTLALGVLVALIKAKLAAH